MRRLSQLSIKSRLVLMPLAVSLVSILVIGFLGWNSSQRALNEAIFDQLTSVRTAKAHQIETYFQGIFDHTATLAEDRMVVEAMTQLGTAHQDVTTWPIVPEWESRLDEYYEQEFVPRLEQNVEGRPIVDLYRPGDRGAVFLQYHYVADNPYPVAQKEGLVASDTDTSPYALLHQRLHPIFRNLVERFGYEDLFLIDIQSGHIVYSVYKEVDFGTSLVDGPHGESNFAQLFRTIQDAPEPDLVRVADFRPYRPSYAAPAAFVAAPIFEGTEAVGVLALKLPVDEINDVMTGGRNWRENGLGETGESYLVGSDLLMRSVSRFLLEDVDAYLELLRARESPEDTVRRIRQFDTTILLQPVNTVSVQNALEGTSGTEVVQDYRDVSVLSSYEPLEIPGLEWVVLSEMDVAEAFAPVEALRRDFIVYGVLLVLLITFAAVGLSRLFVRPIEVLIGGVERVGAGDHDVTIDLQANDEFGDLARAFNEMVANLRQQTELIEEKNAENERLLLTILPAAIADRLKAGERVADRLEQVSVIFIRMLGFAEIAHREDAEASARLLDQLIDALDDAAADHGVERVKTYGETYVAACGITSPRLDHARRVVDFAMDAIALIQQHNREHGSSLALQIGVNSGPVLAGVVGGEKFAYEVWGDTVNIVHRIHTKTAPNTIIVTEGVYDRLRTFHGFDSVEPVERDAGGDVIDVWVLRTDAADGGSQDSVEASAQ